MDHERFAQLLGNYGEFLGAIAVVATLVYLAIQVRQNTKMLRSDIYAAWAQTTAGLHEMRVQNAGLLAGIYAEPIRTYRELSPSEKYAHDALFMHVMNALEGSYLNYVDGAIDESIFEAKRRNMVNYLGRHPLNLSAWLARKPGPWDLRFVDYVDSNVVPKVQEVQKRKQDY